MVATYNYTCTMSCDCVGVAGVTSHRKEWMELQLMKQTAEWSGQSLKTLTLLGIAGFTRCVCTYVCSPPL